MIAAQRSAFLRPHPSSWKWMLAALLASGVGCHSSWQAATYPARGSITINGEPPAGAVVTLFPTGDKVDERNSKPWGVVDASGNFTLQTYVTDDGAPAGDYVVTVKWPWDVNDMSLAMSDRLGGAYAFPDKSDRKVAIVASENVLDMLEITRAKVATKPSSSPRTKAAGPPGPLTPNR